MATKLTNEQANEVEASPHQAIPSVNAQTGKVYYIVDEEFLFGEGQQGDIARDQLRALIQEGLDSGRVEKEEAHARMRATIDKYRNKTA